MLSGWKSKMLPAKFEVHAIPLETRQVARLPPRFPEPPRQELVKRPQVLQPPVLSRPHLAQIPAEFERSSCRAAEGEEVGGVPVRGVSGDALWCGMPCTA
jgi:hypothetical protein